MHVGNNSVLSIFKVKRQFKCPKSLSKVLQMQQACSIAIL